LDSGCGVGRGDTSLDDLANAIAVSTLINRWDDHAERLTS
jgi:hypothetical protein